MEIRMSGASLGGARGFPGPFSDPQIDAEVKRMLAQKHACENPVPNRPARELVRQVDRLFQAREHAMHLNTRLNQMLDRIRGVQPAESCAAARIASHPGPNEPPVLDLLSDGNTALADTLAAIDRAVSELETIA